MLQSSIYPECYGVPCEYFFVIKFLFELDPNAPTPINLKKLCLNMKDKTKERGSSVYEDVNITIDRKLLDQVGNGNNQEVRPQGAIIHPKGKTHVHNILLYTENLG